MNLEIQAALEVADETDAFLQITDVIYDREADIGYESLTPTEKTVYCIDGLSRAMENGGFSLLFNHETGALCSDILDGLEKIRAKNSMKVVQQVVNFFPEGQVPIDEDERSEAYDSLSNEWFDEIAQCDDRFHDAGENLVELTLTFVSKNLSDFY